MEEALTFLKAAACTTRAAEASLSSESYSDEEDEEEEEDGPYFDLEFTAKENYRNAQLTESTTTMSDDVEDDEDEDEETELKFECADENIQGIATSDDNELFFKGDLVTIEPSSTIDLLNEDANDSEVMNGSKVPVFLLKLLLKLKKSKPISTEKSSSSSDEQINEDDDNNNDVVEAENENNNINNNKVGGGVNKLFTVKFKVHEVPLVSALFTRDNSSKEKLIRQDYTSTSESNESTTHHDDAHAAISTTSDDHHKKQQMIAKEVQKYLKMVKPFYVRVSKRYAERLKGTKCGAPVEESTVKDGGNVGNIGNNLQAGLRLVKKRLGKSRSASSAAVVEEEAALTSPATVTVNRRDDSLLQVQDGIQGAIMHCKRSFNASQQSI